MKRGLDWYKREPRAMLDAKRAANGSTGMTIQQAAIYDLVVDLIYEGAGETPNNPQHFASHFSNLGTRGARQAVDQLINMGKLEIIPGGMLTEKRAQKSAISRRNLSEIRAESGRKGGVSSGISRQPSLNLHDNPEAKASSKTEAEIEREKKEREGKPSPKKRASRLSPDWTLPKSWGQWAIEQGVSEPTVRLEADKFRDYWIGVSGRNATKADWQATWRNWIRKVVSDGRGGYMNGAPKIGDTKLRGDGVEMEYQGPMGWAEVHS